MTRRRQYVLAQIGDSVKSFRQVFPGRSTRFAEFLIESRSFTRNRNKTDDDIGYASAINGLSFRRSLSHLRGVKKKTEKKQKEKKKRNLERHR